MLCLLVLTCTEQGGTRISEEVKREINEMIKRNIAMGVSKLREEMKREIHELVDRNREANEITVKGKLFNFQTCQTIDLRHMLVRCMSFLRLLMCAALFTCCRHSSPAVPPAHKTNTACCNR